MAYPIKYLAILYDVISDFIISINVYVIDYEQDSDLYLAKPFVPEL